MNQILEEPFNLEDFLNISLGNAEDESFSAPASQSGAATWTSFEESSSRSFASPHRALYADSSYCAPVINFDGASLMDGEELVDPFAMHSSRPNSPTRHLVDDHEFKRKLEQRRLKLDHLARRLSAKDQTTDSNNDWLSSHPSTACNSPQIRWSLALETPGDCKTSKITFFDRTPLQAYSMTQAPVYLCKNEEVDDPMFPLPSLLEQTQELLSQSASSITLSERELCRNALISFISLGLL
jgi:hypothetical protein